MTDSLWIWWLLLAVLLVILEIFVPSAILIWFAVGALAAMVTALIPGLDLPWQLGVFSIASLAGLFIFRPYVKARLGDAEDGREINDFSTNLVGSSGVIVEAIEDGKGRARVGETIWTVTGPDLPVKARIRVVSVDSTRLGVKADDAY